MATVSGYIRRSFYVPLVSRYGQLEAPLSLATLNLELAAWLSITANARVHATTKEVPQQRLYIEHAALQPRPPCPPVQDCAVDQRTQAKLTESLQHPLARYDALLELT